jgi:hypothetical protein
LIASEFFDRFRTFLICHALHLSNCSNHRCKRTKSQLSIVANGT